KTGQEVDGRAGRPAAGERNPGHLVARQILAIPAPVLSDEGPFGEGAAEAAVAGERETEGRHMGSQGVIRLHGRGHQFRLLGPHARVEILSPVAVWPAVE